ncbi:MAG: M28 family peptidase [Gemmatimonadaceae bacterium]
MSLVRSRSLLTAALVALAAAPTASQTPAHTSTPITAAGLRQRLFIIAHDSMMGRRPGEAGDFKTAEYIAAEFKRFGLAPAGDNGTYFQTVPFFQVAVDPASRITLDGAMLAFDADWLPSNLGTGTRSLEGLATVYPGTTSDSAHWPSADAIAGRAVVFAVPAVASGRREYVRVGIVAGNPRFRRAAAIVLAERDLVARELASAIRGGALTPDSTRRSPLPPALLMTPRAAALVVGGAIEQITPGTAGKAMHGSLVLSYRPVAYPARNIVGILRGSDPALSSTYVSVTAHNDHVGFNNAPVDHDSVRAYLKVKRPMGADSPDTPVTSPEQSAKIAQLLDSLRHTNTARRDSIMNGADDDGSGTVALLEIAEELSGRAARPRRSIIFVSHTGEEYGLIGSGWFTDHATVAVDSIVGELDMDMIGRGGVNDLPAGGPTYLEVVGAKRLSTQFGDALEAANATQPRPFVFNYEYDVPGHPLQYYCRADHYNYARYGIPAVAFSRGEHLDYHQVTDEPQYIDYDAIARVAAFVRDAAVSIANRDARPALDHPKGDPHAQCRQ